MRRYLIKFVSVDGLTRFEERSSENRPPDYLYRVETYVPMVGRYDDYTLTNLQTVKRKYALVDSGLHLETGQYIFEYREIA